MGVLLRCVVGCCVIRLHLPSRCSFFGLGLVLPEMGNSQKHLLNMFKTKEVVFVRSNQQNYAVWKNSWCVKRLVWSRVPGVIIQLTLSADKHTDYSMGGLGTWRRLFKMAEGRENWLVTWRNLFKMAANLHIMSYTYRHTTPILSLTLCYKYHTL